LHRYAAERGFTPRFLFAGDCLQILFNCVRDIGFVMPALPKTLDGMPAAQMHKALCCVFPHMKKAQF
jgi:hypothetical protein